MTTKIKKQTLSKALLCKIVLVLFIGFSSVACGNNNEPQEKKLSGTVTANADGVILFQYSPQNSNVDYCTFTTDLESPYNQFVLAVTAGETTVKKMIEGLEAEQKVSWTATVSGGKPLNHGSNYFVHIVNN